MAEWKPITELELIDQIQKTEFKLAGELLNFWQLIKINPTKWVENQFGVEGGGFWVVAICGTKVIWYNDIEDGFDISEYTTYGQIDEYFCNQYDLSHAVIRLFELIKFGGKIIGPDHPKI